MAPRSNTSAGLFSGDSQSRWAPGISRSCRVLFRPARDSVGVRLLTRNGYDWAPRYPLIVEAFDDTLAEVLESSQARPAMLHWILPRLAAYIAVVVVVGLLFLAGASVYALMWPKPVVPFGQMGH
jgi:hypothetical protein